MAKCQDSKKNVKKEATKTLKEKRAEKKLKKTKSDYQFSENTKHIIVL